MWYGSTPYIGEIMMFGGNYAPNGWMTCSGQVLSIDEYDALFSLIGTTYGGDGQDTFNLPDLRGRIPIHFGTNYGINYTLGQTGGSEAVTLTSSQMPIHTHSAKASSTPGNSDDPSGKVWAKTTASKLYAAAPGNAPLNPASISPVGGSQSHDNMHPILVVTFCIAVVGVYPSQN